MSSSRRREILAPFLYNDGSLVPEQLLVETFSELRAKFGPASWETQTVHGLWEHEGAIYRENLTRFLGTSGCSRAPGLFSRIQGKIEQRFRQLDVWITSHAVDVI